jgi:hypothetical protein
LRIGSRRWSKATPEFKRLGNIGIVRRNALVSETGGAIKRRNGQRNEETGKKKGRA